MRSDGELRADVKVSGETAQDSKAAMLLRKYINSLDLSQEINRFQCLIGDQAVLPKTCEENRQRRAGLRVDRRSARRIGHRARPRTHHLVAADHQCASPHLAKTPCASAIDRIDASARDRVPMLEVAERDRQRIGRDIGHVLGLDHRIGLYQRLAPCGAKCRILCAAANRPSYSPPSAASLLALQLHR